MKRYTIGLFLMFLAFSSTVFADESTEDLDAQYQIDAILIDGLIRTKPFVVTRELLFGEGDVTTKRDIEESIQRIRNLGLFRIAEYELLDRTIPLPNGEKESFQDGVPHRVMRIIVDERWTLLPFGTFSRGGGTFALSTGIFDSNTLGQYIETGFEYVRFGDTNSFGVWLFNPRFLNERLFFGTTFYQTNRIQFERGDDGAIEAGYFRFRRSFTATLNKEWVRWFRTGATVSFASDEYSDRFIPESIIEGQGGEVPDDERPFLLSGTATVGRMNSNRFLRHGMTYSHSITGSSPVWGSTLKYISTGGLFRTFVLLPLESNLGFRAGAGVTTVKKTPYLFHVGGFGEVRGFLHRRFRGNRYWFANTEYRIPSLDTRVLVLQHIVFADIARAAEAGETLFDVSGASAGIGLRIIIPKIFGFVARFDYAFPFVGEGRSAISFGSQQFF